MGWAGQGAVVTGQSKEAGLNTSDDSLAGPQIFLKKFAQDTQLEMISASWGFILSCICRGTSGHPLPPPTSPVGPSECPLTGVPEGRGCGWKWSSNDPRPHTPISPHPSRISSCG